VAFDAGVVGQGQAVSRRIVVGLQVSDEAVQLWQIIHPDRGHPGVEIPAATLGNHLRKFSDVASKYRQPARS
jgi:hypothetical protein